MKLIDRIDSLLSLAKAGIEIIRRGGDSSVVIADLRERLQTLQEQLLDVREMAAALKAENLDLKERLAQAGEFSRQKERYALERLESGSTVYALRPGADIDEPPHYLCANCFDDGKKSILQFAEREFRYDRYECRRCGTKVLVPHGQSMEARTTGGGTDFSGFI